MRSLMCTVLFLFIGLASAAETPVPNHAVVFIYHRFGDDRYPSTNTKVSQFRAQLDWLAANHYQVWPLPQIVEYLKDNKPIPDRKSVV